MCSWRSQWTPATRCAPAVPLGTGGPVVSGDRLTHEFLWFHRMWRTHLHGLRRPHSFRRSDGLRPIHALRRLRPLLGGPIGSVDTIACEGPEACGESMCSSFDGAAVRSAWSSAAAPPRRPLASASPPLVDLVLGSASASPQLSRQPRLAFRLLPSTPARPLGRARFLHPLLGSASSAQLPGLDSASPLAPLALARSPLAASALPRPLLGPPPGHSVHINDSLDAATRPAFSSCRDPCSSFRAGPTACAGSSPRAHPLKFSLSGTPELIELISCSRSRSRTSLKTSMQRFSGAARSSAPARRGFSGAAAEVGASSAWVLTATWPAPTDSSAMSRRLSSHAEACKPCARWRARARTERLNDAPRAHKPQQPARSRLSPWRACVAWSLPRSHARLRRRMS